MSDWASLQAMLGMMFPSGPNKPPSGLRPTDFPQETAPLVPRAEGTDSDVQVEAVPFYPSDRHVKYNLAPERSLDTLAVSEIARVRKLAEERGVLSKELGEQLLPMAMVEGWGSGMGVKGGNKFYASQRFRNALEKLDLKEETDYMPVWIKGDKHFELLPTDENAPRLAAAILAEKAAITRKRGQEDVEAAVKAYNGKGKSTEMWNGQAIPADVDVYWKKVTEAARLLAHPLNKRLHEHYTREYSK